MGPAGFEPASQRIQAQLQYSDCFTLFHDAAVNLADCSSVPTDIRFSHYFYDLWLTVSDNLQATIATLNYKLY